jgi:transporter family-2 protein
MDSMLMTLTLVAGAVLPVKAGANAQLSKRFGCPFIAAMLQLLIGTAVLLVVTLLNGELGALLKFSSVRWWHAMGGLASALYVVSGIVLFPRLGHGRPTMPWWSWIGGVAGAYYVMMVFIGIPVIGAATTIGLTIVGQQLTSAIVDRYGLLGLPQRPLSMLRIASVFLLVIGVALVRLVE